MTNSSDLEPSHTPEAIARRIDRASSPSYLRDFLYGAIDGIVTTFAIVAGVAGAQLSEAIVVVLGLANLLADGASMAASNFLGSRAQLEEVERARQEEARHIAALPEGERAEVREIFRRKGFEGELLDGAVTVITEDRERWIETMLQDEHGLGAATTDPMRAALATFAAFLVAGSVPLLVYLLNLVVPGAVAEPFVWSAALAGLAFATVGAVKGRIVRSSTWRSALETLLIGGGAAAIAYWIGAALRGLLGDGAGGV